jgi:CubicO group peptidase (beta-lactamase class C family)
MYSNVAQSAILPVIEALSGKPFEQYIKEEIFEPLGMVSSGYSAREAGADLPTGYQAIHNEQGLENRLLEISHALDRLGGSFGMTSGRLITTIEDMVGNRIGIGRLTLQARLLSHLRDHPSFPEISVPIGPHEVLEGKMFGGPFIGTGTTSFLLDGHLMGGHYGECAGFRAHILRISSLRCGIALLANSTEGGDLFKWIEAWLVGKLTNKPDLAERMHKE